MVEGTRPRGWGGWDGDAGPEEEDGGTSPRDLAVGFARLGQRIGRCERANAPAACFLPRFRKDEVESAVGSIHEIGG